MPETALDPAPVRDASPPIGGAPDVRLPAGVIRLPRAATALQHSMSSIPAMHDHVRATLIARLERVGCVVARVDLPDSARPIEGERWTATARLGDGRSIEIACRVCRLRRTLWRLAISYEPVPAGNSDVGSPNPLRGFRRVWGGRTFRLLLVSQTLSTTGDRIALVALAVLVTQRTGSTAALGLVFGVQAAALVTCLLIGGVIADRLPRHRVMLATDLVRGGLHLLVGLLIAFGGLALWMLVAIEVVFGAAEAFFRPAFSGIVPQTVAEDAIQEANAANSLTQTFAQFVGPLFATGLIVTFGTASAFLIDAATFLLSAALVAQMRPRRRGLPRRREPMLRELHVGYREVRSRSWVGVTILVFSLHLFVAIAPYMVLGPTVAAQRYGGIPLWGWVVAAVGFGTALGALAALRWRPRHPLFTGLLAVVPFGGLLVACATGLSFGLVLPLAAVAGAGVALFMVWWETALAQRIPPSALSRVSSIDWLASYALLPVGYLLIGYLAGHFGATLVMGIGGACAMVLPLVALCPRQTRALT